MREDPSIIRAVGEMTSATHFSNTAKVKIFSENPPEPFRRMFMADPGLSENREEMRPHP